MNIIFKQNMNIGNELMLKICKQGSIVPVVPRRLEVLDNQADSFIISPFYSCGGTSHVYNVRLLKPLSFGLG